MTTDQRVKGGIGESTIRPDGVAKLQGDFAFLNDLFAEGMLHGATLRSPYAKARIVRLDIAPALAMPGVHAVLTHDDVPGDKTFGLVDADQPVLAHEITNYWGEPVAIVAADDPETARRAVAAIDVEFEELEPLIDSEEAVAAGEVFREMDLRSGDQELRGEVVVEGYYETAMQDQAPLGTEAGLAIPDGEGGVDLYAPTQWVHADHEQILPCLGLEPDQLRVHPGGLGGAFGSREDISLQIHACLLALRTGRPVKFHYDRGESFIGHVHRHPSRMWYRHEADAEGNLVRVEAKLILDGGAYASTTGPVLANATYFAVGPYKVPSVAIHGFGTRTNNPPCGAMRGFGAVQSCFGSEAQMDKLAAALEMDPMELRRKNMLVQGDHMPTSGQRFDRPLPTDKVIEELLAMPLPPALDSDDPRHLPGGTGLTTERSSVKRGVGYALGLKNLMFSEGFDDSTEVRMILNPAGAEIHAASVECGQGMINAMQQVGRTVLGLSHVAWVFDDTSLIGSAGSTSASRQTPMTGGAVYAACVGLRDKVLEQWDGDDLSDDGVHKDGELVATLDQVCADGPVEFLATYRHPPTSPPDENFHGDVHVDFGIAGHRAVVDVDEELGLVRVISVDTVQDVGKVLNPTSVVGQMEGGTMQGVGLAVMEEIVLRDGKMLNANFTDYLLPTFLDAPTVDMVLLEEEGGFGPFGAKGIAESPTISSTPAIVAAIRNATGKPLTRVPVRPEDIVGL
ncbi:MAG: molybdopterin cofactor-binding domain-containing protein [Acidimicrobiia bacterium]